MPRRPPARRATRIAITAGVVIVLGSGAVWLGPSPGPRFEVSAPAAGGARPLVARGRDTLGAPDPPAATVDQARAATPPPAVPREIQPRTRGARPLERARPRAHGGGPAEPGRLSISAIPWGSVLVDGQAMGDTPLIDLRLAAGSHTVRVERDGFNPDERRIELAPGQHLRLTGIVLVER